MTDTPLQAFPTEAPLQAPAQTSSVADAMAVMGSLSSEVDAESAARQARYEAVANLKHQLDAAKEQMAQAVMAVNAVAAAWASLKAQG